MQHMLKKVGWKKKFVDEGLPVLPISGWMGDNLITKSEKMDWWKGVEVVVGGTAGGVYKIKGVGDVLTGRVEQGAVKPGNECLFLPTHSASTSCTGKIFTVEMHHKNVPEALQGDNA